VKAGTKIHILARDGSMAFGELLERLKTERVLVDVRRDDLDAGDLRGFVVGVSDELALIAVVSDHVRRDGFTILRRSDITFLRWGMARMKAWERVVDRGGRRGGRVVRDAD